MRGQILSFEAGSGAGLIGGEDGNRYSFGAGEWKGLTPPQPGDSVDFVAADGTATGIFPLPAGGASSAPAGNRSAAAPPASGNPAPSRSEGSSVALGIVGIACLVLGFVIPVLPTIAAFILGLVGADSAKRHGNDTGLVLSRISWIGALALLIIGAALLVFAMAFAWPLLDMMWQMLLQAANEEAQNQRAVLFLLQ